MWHLQATLVQYCTTTLVPLQNHSRGLLFSGERLLLRGEWLWPSQLVASSRHSSTVLPTVYIHSHLHSRGLYASCGTGRTSLSLPHVPRVRYCRTSVCLHLEYLDIHLKVIDWQNQLLMVSPNHLGVATRIDRIPSSIATYQGLAASSTIGRPRNQAYQ